MSACDRPRSEPSNRRTSSSQPLSLPPLILLTSTLPVREGDGVPRFVLDLAVAMAHYCHVTLLAPHSSGAAKSEESRGVSIRRFSYFFPSRLERLTAGGVIAVNLRDSLLAWLQVPFLLIAQGIALLSTMRETKATVVNTHWLVPQGLTAAVVRIIKPFTHVLHVHAADVYLLQRIPLGRYIARFVVNRCDAVLADGSHVKHALDILIGRDSMATLRPMGVWTDSFARSEHLAEEGSDFILFVGRFVEKKGIPFLLRAMVSVRERFPELRLVLIGDGPMEERLREDVVRLGLEDAVTFAGPRPHDDVVRYLHACRLACVPSIVDSRGETEGMPTVVVEAMAAGVPVVGSNVDGIPDVISHAENGWLAEPEDVDDLAWRIIEALDSPHREEVADQAAITSARHDWLTVAAEYTKLIGSVQR